MLRRMGYSKDAALDRAGEFLAQQREATPRRTIEASYDLVRRDMMLRGRESEFFYFVAEADQVHLPKYVPYLFTE